MGGSELSMAEDGWSRAAHASASTSQSLEVLAGLSRQAKIPAVFRASSSSGCPNEVSSTNTVSRKAHGRQDNN
jgi:hypothetical protein